MFVSEGRDRGNKIHLHVGAKMSSQERTRAEVGKEVREMLINNSSY